MLDPRMQVGETLAEPLRYLGINRADRERRVREVAEHLGLSARVLELYPTELSAGVQQRVGIGRAIVTRPELIVLDEPTSALDPTARAEIVDLLIRLQGELGTAYLLISHDLSTVRFISHRVAVLYLGTIVEEAESERLFARPLHPYSVGLLASVLLPDPELKRSSSIRLEGEIPSPIDLPPGCPLAGRCPFADARCHKERPPVLAVGPRHLVSCFHHDRVAALDQTVDQFARFQEEFEPPPQRRGGLTAIFGHSTRRSERMGKLSGKVALVTGGASGIGRASVLALAAEGAAIGIVDRNLAGAEAVAAEAAKLGVPAATAAADVGDEAQVGEAFGRIVESSARSTSYSTTPASTPSASSPICRRRCGTR